MLFVEVQHGSQSSFCVVRGNSGFHSSRCRGIRPYLKLRGNSVFFQIEAGTLTVSSSYNRGDSPPPEA